MRTILASLYNTLELLIVLAVSSAEAAYIGASPQARVYFKSLLVTALAGLILVPALALAKMVTGVVVFAYAAALIAIVFTLVLGLLWSPLGVVMGMLAENTLNPLVGGERFVRFVATILFVELMISGYIIRVPTHQNLEAVPMLVITAAAVGLGTFVWGGWLSGRFYTFVATVVMFLTTLSFFAPQTYHTLHGATKNMDVEMASAIKNASARTIHYPVCANAPTYRFSANQNSIQVPIQPDCWSGWVVLPTDSTGTRGLYTWWGTDSPGELEFAFPDGRRILLEADEASYGWLPPGHRFRLRGPGPVTVNIER